MCLDTGHENVVTHSAGDAVRLLGTDYMRVLHVHDNDGIGDRHWRMYEGTTDWEDFSNALFEIGFDGTLSLETAPLIKPEMTPEQIEESEIKLVRDAYKIAKREYNP